MKVVFGGLELVCIFMGYERTRVRIAGCVSRFLRCEISRFRIAAFIRWLEGGKVQFWIWLLE